MNRPIYLVYINGQSTRPLVHSIEEAKSRATPHIGYQPSLREVVIVRTLMEEYRGTSWDLHMRCANHAKSVC